MNPLFLIVGGVILLILFASVKFFRVLFLIGIAGVMIYFIATPNSAFYQLRDKFYQTKPSQNINYSSNNRSSRTSNYSSSSNWSFNTSNNYDNDRIIEDAQRQINNIGDAFLGKGTTEKITNIVNDDNRTPEQAAKDIIREIPTGLPKIVDNYVKGMVGKMLDASTK